MDDFRSVYRKAEEHTTALAVLLFVVLVGLIAAQVFVSALTILSAVVGGLFLLMTFFRPLWTLGFLAAYLPFEPFLIKFVPDDMYVFARYFSEILIYVLVFVTLWKILNGEARMRPTPADLPFILFLVVLAASTVINFVDPTVAILGARQILRFILIFFVTAYLAPKENFIRNLTTVMLAIILLEAGLGIMQAVVGAPLDELLLPSEAHTVGEITLTSGVTQFWDPGSRVFATLGRYDRLGTFLAFFLLIGAAFLYEYRLRKEKRELWWLFLLGLPALVLTYSRSSWFGFLLGFLFIGLWVKRDRRVLLGVAAFAVILASYLAYTGLVVRYLTDTPSQTVAERFFEAFSYERWRGEYYGLGRLYWIVQTPTVVVPASPFFGFGPGQYGGGAAAALGNTGVYDRLGLPYGVYGTDGYIDNNWFSLWGETGTLGFAFYLWMYASLALYAMKVYRKSQDPMVRTLALGLVGAMLAVALNAFLASFLEVRTLAFYLWMYAGFVVVLGRREQVEM